MTSIISDPLLSAESVAKLLDSSVEHVRDLITQQRLKAIKLGRSVKVRASELDRYVLENAKPKN